MLDKFKDFLTCQWITFLQHLLFAKYIKKKLKSKKLICVSPDVGGVQRTRGLATKLKADLAIIDKRRPKPGKSQVMNIIGNVKKKLVLSLMTLLIVEELLLNAVDALKKSGATEVYVFITHAVLSGDAANKIKKSKIKKLILLIQLITLKK